MFALDSHNPCWGRSDNAHLCVILIPRHCGVLVCTPYSSGFVRAALGLPPLRCGFPVSEALHMDILRQPQGEFFSGHFREPQEGFGISVKPMANTFLQIAGINHKMAWSHHKIRFHLSKRKEGLPRRNSLFTDRLKLIFLFRAISNRRVFHSEVFQYVIKISSCFPCRQTIFFLVLYIFFPDG